MMRDTPARVNIATSVATSSGWPRCTRPPTPEYSPSEFSRTITQSSSGPDTSRSGLTMPGRTRVGRTLAYWSSGWQMASRRPHRVMWSGTSGTPADPNRMASWPLIRSRPLSVVVGAPVEVLDRKREAAVAAGADVKRLKPGRDHLGPDSVAADRRDLVYAHDGRPHIASGEVGRRRRMACRRRRRPTRMIG